MGHTLMGYVRSVRVESAEGLIRSLWAGSWRADIGRHRPSTAFRGVSRPTDLQSSLMRLGGAFEKIEAPMLRAFRRYARGTLPGDATTWDWLSLAQHHGVPTRLLDWTHSPFVAMHFATSEHAREDGEIHCVDYRSTNLRLPARLRRALVDEGGDLFGAESLARVAPGLAELDSLSRRPFVMFLEPPSLDARITNQFALFSLMGSARSRLDAFLREAPPKTARKVVIPAALKPRVRDLLDQANVTERVLFPGLDGLARYLARYYAPSGE